MSNKYGARKTTIDGITFDSAAEARRYQELRLLEAAGEIERLTLQPRFVLQEKYYDGWNKKTERAITYKADFMYMEADLCIVEDVKGKRTRDFDVKWKWVKRLNSSVWFKIVEA